MMHDREGKLNRREWAARLRRLADPVVARLDPRAELNAALSRRGWLGAPVMARAFGHRIAAPTGLKEDLGLWWSLVDVSVDWREHVDLNRQGPLFEPSAFLAIEVWTETELAGLHALTNLALERGEPAAAERARSAALWHLEHTQPDNATNRPWAVHAFLDLGQAESRHFAETLLGNCQVLQGEPDAFSACLLLDAAAALNRDEPILNLR